MDRTKKQRRTKHIIHSIQDCYAVFLDYTYCEYRCKSAIKKTDGTKNKTDGTKEKTDGTNDLTTDIPTFAECFLFRIITNNKTCQLKYSRIALFYMVSLLSIISFIP